MNDFKLPRRDFFQSALAAQAAAPSQTSNEPADFNEHGGVVIERAQSGRPHLGKTLAAIQPHSDDIPIFAAGTVRKLIREGYTAYLIRVTNDDMAGPGGIAETVTANERDNFAVARVMGFRRTFDLNYNNHMMDSISRAELRARFIFLFRLLKIDTVVTYDPWDHYEENPEHFAAGLTPHGVKEKYYFARFQQRVNRVVDISSTVEDKINANLENQAQGPAGLRGVQLRASLNARNLRLPLLEGDDLAANRNYIREFVLRENREIGRRFGLEYAEQFHYIGPEPDAVAEYVSRNAVPR
jgi:hypothetical protein